ncbi:hypothetical protein H7J07_06370 [Mycobacterium koreense]|nr:hypothetical protein [Mycolicibacillus koreensis]MCV7247845.1 hypothetical protein [Mycolicibacillus koreensis]BBY53015.1 hypothetical protein MKOR_02660 [Mycolicibacillus koreensis]
MIEPDAVSGHADPKKARGARGDTVLGLRLPGNVATLRAHDKEIKKSWKMRARNVKTHRIIWVFAVNIPIAIIAIGALNTMAQQVFDLMMRALHEYYLAHGDTPGAWRFINIAWAIDRLALWAVMLLIGLLMMVTIVFLCYVYKQIVSELSLWLPWLSVIIFVAFAWFSIKWASVLAAFIRRFVPSNLYDVYDFVLKFAVPISEVYVGVVAFWVIFVRWATRIQLHRGFRLHGEGFRERDYFQRWTASDVETVPGYREQMKEIGKELKCRWRKERRTDDDEPMPSYPDTLREMWRAVFPKDL